MEPVPGDVERHSHGAYVAPTSGPTADAQAVHPYPRGETLAARAVPEEVPLSPVPRLPGSDSGGTATQDSKVEPLVLPRTPAVTADAKSTPYSAPPSTFTDLRSPMYYTDGSDSGSAAPLREQYAVEPPGVYGGIHDRRPGVAGRYHHDLASSPDVVDTTDSSYEVDSPILALRPRAASGSVRHGQNSRDVTGVPDMPRLRRASSIGASLDGMITSAEWKEELARQGSRPHRLSELNGPVVAPADLTADEAPTSISRPTSPVDSSPAGSASAAGAGSSTTVPAAGLASGAARKPRKASEDSGGPELTGYQIVGRGAFRFLEARDVDAPVNHKMALVLNTAATQQSSTPAWLKKLCDSCKSRRRPPETLRASSSTGRARRLLEAAARLDIIHKLCRQGLIVDVLQGGLVQDDHGEARVSHHILLIRAPRRVIEAKARVLTHDLWLRRGHVRSLQIDVAEPGAQATTLTEAERIEVLYHIIREDAGVYEGHPWVHSLFPLHDMTQSREMVLKWAKSLFRVRESLGWNKQHLGELRDMFGERVAYYFVFSAEFCKALFPIAILGVLVSLVRTVLGTPAYMRILPFWGFFVCVVWAFGFLKYWERRNAEYRFEWGDVSSSDQYEYLNPKYHGVPRTDPVTGESYLHYDAWRRWPKFVLIQLFMLVNISIVLVATAMWASIYEALKTHYPDSEFLGTQWWLIFLEGIILGLFVDTFQWSVITKVVGKAFTQWENYRTEEEFESALVRKLFVFDMLNYFTWFFIMAFVYVEPHLGDKLTNLLNTLIWRDPSNCCFGPYLATNSTMCIGQSIDNQCCQSCPDSYSDPRAVCVPCKGPFQFNKDHVDLQLLFITPVLVTQALNLLLAILLPRLSKYRMDLVRQRREDKVVRSLPKGQSSTLSPLSTDTPSPAARSLHPSPAAGPSPVIARFAAANQSPAIGQSPPTGRTASINSSPVVGSVLSLSRKARAILAESDMDEYDPYSDYHLMGVYFFFVTGFSIVWPWCPLVVMGFLMVKLRADGFRMCFVSRRPMPRKVGGIGEWRNQLYVEAFLALVLNVALACFSTGALDFYSEACVSAFAQLTGNNISYYLMGPDYECMGYLPRMIVSLVTEHILIALALFISTEISSLPNTLRKTIAAKETAFKAMLLRQLDVDFGVRDPEQDLSSTSGPDSESECMMVDGQRVNLLKPRRIP